jgi:phosphoribosyl-AMP cyclohydrolase
VSDTADSVRFKPFTGFPLINTAGFAIYLVVIRGHAGQTKAIKITHNTAMNCLDEVKWDAQGLVPVIAQERGSGDVLMFAYMNRQALQKTIELKRAVYFSRSRNKIWFKGEESGHVQTVHDIRLDCDGDVILLTITQLGHAPDSATSPAPSIACHTGRHSCFFKRLEDIEGEKQWQISDPILKDPQSIYSKAP